MWLYFVVIINNDSYTEVLEMNKLDNKLDDKLVSLYLDLINFRYGKVITFKGELVDVEFKCKNLDFTEVKDILDKYKFLKDDEEKGSSYELIKEYIEKIYLSRGD
jgi:hypothetical protein